MPNWDAILQEMGPAALQAAGAVLNPIGTAVNLGTQMFAPPPPPKPQPAPAVAGGHFDDLIPSAPRGGHFDDLVPGGGAPPPNFHQSVGAGAVRAAAEGVPLLGQLANQGDAAFNATVAPAVEPLLDMLPGHDRGQDINAPTWGQRYDKDLAWQNGMSGQFAQDHPVVNTGAKITGGVLGALAGAKYLSPASGLLAKAAPGAGMVPNMLANAIDGGLVGGGMGYLGGSGGWNDPSRIGGAEMGGALGAGGGALVAPAAAAGKAIWGATGAKALDAMFPKVQIGAPAPAASLADAISPAAAAAPGNSGLADAVTGGLPTPSVTVPQSAASGAYNRVYRAIQRGGQTPDAALSQVGKLGPNGMLADATVPAQDFARTVADSPGQGGQIARDALNLRQSGSLANGQYSLPPASQRIGDTLASSLGVKGQQYDADIEGLIAQQKAAAAPAYAKAYSSPPVPLEALQDFSASPMFSNAYNRARAISQTDFVPQPDGSMKLQPLPAKPGGALDWRTLDLMKQGMDDTYREGVTGGIGVNAQRSTQGFRNAFVNQLDTLNPDYAAARAAFSGPAQSMDALDAGRSFLKDDASGIGDQLSGLSPGDQQMYRVGAVQGMRDRLGSVPNTANAAGRAGVATDNMMGKLQSLFPDQQSYGDFHNSLQNEQTMFDTRARVLGGSQTARNLEGQGDAGVDPFEGVGALGKIATGDHVGGLADLARMLWRGGNGQGMSEPTANAAAAILFHPNPGSNPALAAGLAAAQRRAAMAGILDGTSGVTGAYAGQGAKNATGAPQP